MGIRNIIGRGLSWAEEKGFSGGTGGVPLYQILRHQASGKRGTSELLSMYETSPHLRSAVSTIGYSVSSTPWETYQVTGGSKRKNKTKSITLQQAGYEARKKLINRYSKDSNIRIVEDHIMLELLAKPNEHISGQSCMKLTQIYLDIVGEAFWLLNLDGNGVPFEIWPLPAHWVTKVPSKDSDFFEVTIDGQRKNFMSDDVIWMRDLNLVNPYGRGTGIGRTLADELEIDEYASKFLKTWFVNRAKPEMLISIEGAEKDMLTRAEEKFNRQNKGIWNNHKSFWHSGKMVVKELQQKFADMELSVLRKDQRNIVNHTFGVPPEILGIVENSNRATIECAEYIYARHVLVPRLDFIRAEIQNKLAPLFDDRLVVGYVSPVPQDQELHLKYMQAQPQIATRGEWRRRAGLEDRGQLDSIHEIPVGLDAERVPYKQ